MAKNFWMRTSKAVHDDPIVQSAKRSGEVLERSISEESLSLVSADLQLLLEGEGSLEGGPERPAGQRKPAGNSSFLTTENIRKLQTPPEAPRENILVNKYFSSIQMVSPTKTDIQAIIAVPGSSQIVPAGTSGSTSEVSGLSADQPEQCSPAMNSHPRRKRFQLPDDIVFMSSPLNTSLQRPLNIDLKQAPAGGTGTQTAYLNNTSYQDVQAVKSYRSSGQRMDQNLGTNQFSSSGKLAITSAEHPKQRNLQTKSAGSGELGRKARFQGSPKRRLAAIHRSTLEHKEFPVQRESLSFQPKAVGYHTSETHSKQVPKESTALLKAAIPPWQNLGSGQRASAKEIQPPGSLSSKRASLAMEGHETQGPVLGCKLLATGEEPIVSDILSARDCSATGAKRWRSLTWWNAPKSTEHDGQVVRTAKEWLPMTSAGGERLLDKASIENYNHIDKSQKKGEGQHFVLKQKLDVSETPTGTDCLKDPVIAKGNFWARTHHRKSEVKRMRAVEDGECFIEFRRRGMLSNKSSDGRSSEVESCGEKELRINRTAKKQRFQVSVPPACHTDGKQGGLQYVTKDVGVQTTFSCMVGNIVQMNRETRHSLLSSLYIRQEEVKYLDASRRPADEKAPFSFGTYASISSMSMGIVKLHANCEKPVAVDHVHDILFFALDDSMSITTVGGVWSLLEKGSTFLVLKGTPYRVKNVGTATSKLLYTLFKPA